MSEASLGAVGRSGIQFGPAGSGVVYCGGCFEIRRSNDNGKTWAVLGAVPEDVRTIENFVADRFDADTISFMDRRESEKALLMLSRDGGKSFANVPFPEGENFAASVSTDPDDKTIVYLCTQNNGWGRGHERRYFYSYDDGASWELLWDPTTEEEADPATRRKLRRVFPDVIPTPVPVRGGTALRRRELAWSEDKPGRVVGEYLGQVLRSDDFGTNWEFAMEGLVSTSIRRIAFDPQDPKAAYCAGQKHLWRTPDHGETWVTMRLDRGDVITAVTFSADGKSVLVLAADGIWRASSEGQDWSKVWESDHREKRPFVLSSYRAKGETGAARHVCVAVGNGFRLESTDGGATWRDAGETNFKQQVYGHVAWPYAQRVVEDAESWFVHDQKSRILSSLDQGRTWELHAPTKHLRLNDWAFAADGTLWTVRNLDAYNRPGGERELAAFSGKGDPTKTFRLPKGLSRMAVACGPEDDQTVYVALTDGRMLRTTDAGRTFALLDGGPRGVGSLCLAVSPHDGALWVGTDGNGVWILDNPKRAEACPVEREH